MTPEAKVWKYLESWVPGSPFAGRVYLVGGCVRDRLLGEDAKDLDLVVEERGGAEAFLRSFHDAHPEITSVPHPMGAGYPIWQLVFKEGKWAGVELQVADTQKEMFPDPATRQRVAVFGSLDEDCARRDFTANMLYWELGRGEAGLRDPSGQGERDLREGWLRGHPQVDLKRTFSDDPLRVLRLARFHARFGWKVDPLALEAARATRGRLGILSAERVRDELLKSMTTSNFARVLELFRETGVLDELFPEFLPMIGCGQDATYHSEGDVWVHTLLVVRNAPRTPALQLAALLHDTGKPATRAERDDGRVTFLGHEKVSEDIARPWLRKWRFGRELAERVCTLVRLHLRGGDVEGWAGLKPARKLLRDADVAGDGGALLEELLQLIEADSRSSLGPDGQPRVRHLPLLRARMAEARLDPPRRQPLLSGGEIMRELGLKPGPRIKELKAWLEEQEDDFAGRGETLDPARALSLLRAHVASFDKGSS
jgi:poly(A) polymerase